MPWPTRESGSKKSKYRRIAPRIEVDEDGRE
jgi:hypothetical protein